VAPSAEGRARCSARSSTTTRSSTSCYRSTSPRGVWRTTPVGAFPNGRTPEGIDDLSGGGWNNGHPIARTAFREFNHPDYPNDNYGFRPVVVGRSR
jgi:formylglycine-generating enzyme required for sulfatase activity